MKLSIFSLGGAFLSGGASCSPFYKTPSAQTRDPLSNVVESWPRLASPVPTGPLGTVGRETVVFFDLPSDAFRLAVQDSNALPPPVAALFDSISMDTSKIKA